MIYMRDNKLLVAAGGLCSNCCYGNDCDCCEPDPFPNGQTPKYFDITFSGVALCPTKSWPDGVNLNTTWELTQDSTYPCVWKYNDGNWIIELMLCYEESVTWATASSALGGYYSGGIESICEDIGSDVANEWLVGDCAIHRGYGGTASWAKV